MKLISYILYIKKYYFYIYLRKEKAFKAFSGTLISLP